MRAIIYNIILIAVVCCLAPLAAWGEIALVPQSGQTACYNDTGAVIPCAGTGQDGDTRMGVPWPEPRFTEPNPPNGTITDNLTGLIWLKNANCNETVGGISNTVGYHTWANALIWSNALASGNCGLTDGSTAGQWRMPNRNELESMVNRQYGDPRTWLTGVGFIGVAGNYWSSSTESSLFGGAYSLRTFSGQFDNSGKTNSNAVWPVRSGQSGNATVQLPRTGQTTNYAPGDDGALQRGVVWPNPRFIDLNDGTAYDSLTGIIWLKSNKCFGLLTWSAAISSANGLSDGQCGLTDGSVAGDWRLPSLQLLESIADISQPPPSVLLPAGHPFTSMSNTTNNDYWSSTTLINPSFPNEAWAFNFNSASIFSRNKTSITRYSWPVRSGQFWVLDSLVIKGYYNFAIGNLAPMVVPLHNKGTTPLPVTSISITGTDANQFNLFPGGATPCASLTPTLVAGEKCTLVLGFFPTSTGSKSALVTVVANGKTLDIPVTGTGIATISGTIHDLSTGNPLAAGSVTITGGATAQSDASGNFIFYQAPTPGVYNVTVNKPGYGSVTINGVSITATQGATLKLGLTAAGTLAINSTVPFPPAEIGKPYIRPVITNGGSGPFVFSVDPATPLPPGLTIDPVIATINGTPTTAGTYPFTVIVTDRLNAQARGSFTIKVPPVLMITNANILPQGIRTFLYTQSLIASGGTAPYTFSISGGLLPPGLNLSPAGVISGVPTLAGTYAFTAKVTDSNGWTASKNFSVTIMDLTTPGPLNINDTVPFPPADTGKPYAAQVYVAGSAGPFTFTMAAGGSLPPGVTLDPVLGTISGTPTTAGISPFSVTVTDNLNRQATGSFNIEVTAPLTITTADTLPRGTLTFSYGQTIEATGGAKPYSFSIASGTLPTGLTLSLSGAIAGKPTTVGAYSFTIKATDKSGRTATMNYTIGIVDPLVQTTVTMPDGSSLADGIVGAPYTATLTASGGYGAYTWFIFSGTLPSGLTFNSSTGVISGTPLVTTRQTVSISVVDIEGRSTFKTYIFNVYNPLQILNTTLPNGNVGLPYVEAVLATGGSTPYSFTITSGTLPAGLTLSPTTGVISGTPTVTGTYTFTAKVTDNGGRTASQIYSITVVQPLVHTTGPLPDGLLGTPYTATLTATGSAGAYTWSIYSGFLPAGLSLNSSTGTVSGTPSEAALQTVVIAVRDIDGRITLRAYNFNVYSPLQMSVTPLPDGFVSVPYAEKVRRIGGKPPFTFSYVGALPTGLSLNPATGDITGIPSVKGLKNIDVTINDSLLPTVQSITQSLGLQIVDVLTITTGASLPSGRRGVAITPITMAARGGALPFTWNLVSGLLPDGIILNGVTGTLSGTPKKTGDFVFTLRCTTSAPPGTADKQFFLRVSDNLVVTTGALPDGALRSPYIATPASSGGIKPQTWVVKTGALPAGLSIDPATGTITGTPTAINTVSFTVEVTDSDTPAQTASKSFTIDVRDSLTISENSLNNARQHQPYTANIRAIRGYPPYTWRVTSGILPPGTTLTQSPGVATIEGTATSGGIYAFSLEVSDSGIPVQTVSRAYTVNVDPVDVSSTPMPDSRQEFSATTLKDGRVLIAGGYISAPLGVSAAGFIYDPASTGWSTAGLFNVPRYSHQAVLLENGKVMILGGWNASFSARIPSAEIYDPAANLWTIAGDMLLPRTDFTASALPGGRVLVTGGRTRLPSATVSTTTNSVDLYDPLTGSWQAVLPLTTARDSHQATLLTDRRILVTGGHNDVASLASAEIFDPASGSWTTVAPMNFARNNHRATLLNDGRVLVSGGYNSQTGAILDAEIYDPLNPSLGWQQAGTMTAGRPSGHATYRLSTGQVVAVGGDIPGTVERFNSATGAWEQLGMLNPVYTTWATAMLQDERILVLGTDQSFIGTGSSMGTAELFDPKTVVSGAAFRTWQPVTITQVGGNVSYVGLPCSGTVCDVFFEAGSQALLVVKSVTDATQEFKGWSGDCIGSAACSLAMTAARNVTATFGPDTTPPVITSFIVPANIVDYSGTTAPVVSFSALTISEGGAISGYLFTENATQPTAGDPGWLSYNPWGYSFSSYGTKTLYAWVKDGAGNISVPASATFNLIDGTRVASVSITVIGAGSVGGSPAGINGAINCVGGSTLNCSAIYAVGTPVTLTPVETPATQFSGWSGGGCSGLGACVVTPLAATAVTATFAPRTVLTLNLAGNGSGTVTVSPQNASNTQFPCMGGSTTTCSGTFAAGTQLILMPTVSGNSTFGGWSANCTLSGDNCLITISANTTVTATFNAPTGSPVQLSGPPAMSFALITDAYNAAPAGVNSTIKVQGVTLIENIILSLVGRSINLMGGFEPSFTTQTGFTTLQGELIIEQGNLTVDRLIIR